PNRRRIAATATVTIAQTCSQRGTGRSANWSIEVQAAEGGKVSLSNRAGRPARAGIAALGMVLGQLSQLARAQADLLTVAGVNDRGGRAAASIGAFRSRLRQAEASAGSVFSAGAPTTTSSWSCGAGGAPTGGAPLSGAGLAFFGAGLVLLAAGAGFA